MSGVTCRNFDGTILTGGWKHVSHFLFWCSWIAKFPFGFVNGELYPEKPKTRSHKYLRVQAVLQPSAFKIKLYCHFHTLMFLQQCMITNLLSTAHHYNSIIQLGYVIKLVMQAWDACIREDGSRSLQNALMLYNNYPVMFEDINGLQR